MNDPHAIYPDDLDAYGIRPGCMGDYSDDDGNAGGVLALKDRNVAFYDDGGGWRWVSRSPSGTVIRKGWKDDKSGLLDVLARHARVLGYPASAG